jgi:hypothetical protein
MALFIPNTELPVPHHDSKMTSPFYGISSRGKTAKISRNSDCPIEHLVTYQVLYVPTVQYSTWYGFNQPEPT